MLTSIEGIYEDGQVRLLEPLPGVERARVVITLLPESMVPVDGTQTPAATVTPDPVVEHFEPRTELGRRLWTLRRKHVEQGGKLLTPEEIDAEVRERRGGIVDD
ncbi:hypothetical protein [Halochromatium glycolicum]|jgi:hypothetical protein|uniref:DUF104 domain-containing protein n=1 Tax=Halochromatium glycolicum TaxID=85075 RepID=A0AAJ0U339_9GAMM|nr:hypothetical protein [Halochromatium glycolicum]MBK1704384.1 hypothetical protein [Halochromatium glycolicum]